MPNDIIRFQAGIAKPNHSSLFIERMLLAPHDDRIGLRFLLLRLWPPHRSSWLAIAEERDLRVDLLLQPRDSREWGLKISFGSTHHRLGNGLLGLLDRSFLILPPPPWPSTHHFRLGLVEHVSCILLVTLTLIRDIWCLHLFLEITDFYLGPRLWFSPLIKFRLGPSKLTIIAAGFQCSMNISPVTEIHASTPHYELLSSMRAVK
jgi:hypothetical protein